MEAQQSGIHWAVDGYCDQRKKTWDVANKDRAWWKVWENAGVFRLTQFLTESLDDLILFLNTQTTMSGAEKKQIVMNAIGTLYDYIAGQCLPIWLKPFSPLIRPLILDGVISPAIDWIVSKYKAAKWKNTATESVIHG